MGNFLGAGLGAVTKVAGGIVGGALGGLFGGESAPPGSAAYDEARMRAVKARMDKLNGELDAVPAAKQLGAAPGAYQARSTQNLPGMAAMKERINNQVGAGAQTSQNALARRAAVIGGGTGGAIIKQQEMINQNAEDQKMAANNELDFQTQQNELQKEFQSQEAQKQNSLAREQYNADAEFKDKVFKFDSKSKLAQIELQFTQSERDAQDQQFNKEMAQYQTSKQGGLLGAGGLLGTGLNFGG
jgi:hypothetical protein